MDRFLILLVYNKNMKKSEAEILNNFEEVINALEAKQEDVVFVTRNGIPVVQMTLINNRIGVAKKEMEGFDISLEEFNSIETFNLN